MPQTGWVVADSLLLKSVTRHCGFQHFVYSGNVESMRADSCSIIYEEECEVGLAQWLYF